MHHDELWRDYVYLLVICQMSYNITHIMKIKFYLLNVSEISG